MKEKQNNANEISCLNGAVELITEDVRNWMSRRVMLMP
jgi:hypothetical protein